MALESFAKYQNYPVETVNFRRSPGMDPEPGWVGISIENLKEIKVQVEAIPWRNLSTLGEMQQGLTIKHFLRAFKGTQSPNTQKVTPPKSGLNNLGELDLETAGTEGDQSPPGPTTFFDIFVDSSGIEELDEDLFFAKKHNEGILRVPVTDIRRFWRDHGIVFQDINVKLRNGEWDPETVETDKDGCPDRPYTASEVFRFLFSQLPGSPAVSLAQNLKLDPPMDVKAAGDLAGNIIRELLDDLGLEVMLQPNNLVFIYRRGSRRVPAQQLPEKLGTYYDPTFWQASEKKSVSIYYRSPAVLAMGKRKVRRMSLAYVPIFQDTDGRYFQLEDVERIWGYPLSKVNKQIFSDPNKSFMDVPPTIGGPGGGKLHSLRREIMKKWAYKGYAPAILFDAKRCKDLQSGGTGSSTTTGLIDTDFEAMHFFPMVDCPFYEFELDLIDEQEPGDAGLKGDLGRFFILPPLVRGTRIGSGLFNDFNEVNRYFNETIDQTGNTIAVFQFQSFQVGRLISDYIKILRRAEFTTADALNKAVKSHFIGKGGMVINIDADIKAAAARVGAKFDTSKLRTDKMNEQTFNAIFVLKRLAANIAAFDKFEDEEKTKLKTQVTNFAKFQEIHAALGAVHMKFMHVAGVVESGHYSLDKDTGIILFSEPMCKIDKPFFFDGDTVVVVGDGGVYVTFGHELRTNSISDWTGVLLTPKDDDGPDFTVSIASMMRATPVKCKPVEVPDMRMYEADLGTPFNQAGVIAQAVGKASGALRTPRKSTGFSHTLHGFHKIAGDEGVDTIQYTFDGDEAKTFVAVNAPSATGPLGLADLHKRDRSTPKTVATRRGEETVRRWSVEDVR